MKMEIKKAITPKTIAILAAIILFSGFLLIYINKFLYKSKASQPGLTVSFAPSTFNAPLGSPSNIRLVLNPNDAGNRMSGFDLYFVPGGNLNIVSFGTPLSVGGGSSVQFTSQINANNRLAYTINAASENELPLHIEIPIVIKSDTVGTGTITVDAGPNRSMVVGPIVNQAYDLGTVPTASYIFGVPPGGSTSPTATGTIAGNMTLNLKLKFQGITRKPADTYNKLMVKVTAVDKLGELHPGTADFVADTNGIWSGSVLINAPAGDHYKILVKGPKHLQKKICVASPTETTGGTYNCSQGNITLTSGANNFDFSGIVQLVGDLPEQGGSGQNGVIDSYDISFIVNNFRSTEPTALAVGDLNLDGVIDGQDYAGLLYSLSIKYDEL